MPNGNVNRQIRFSKKSGDWDLVFNPALTAAFPASMSVISQNLNYVTNVAASSFNSAADSLKNPQESIVINCVELLTATSETLKKLEKECQYKLVILSMEGLDSKNPEPFKMLIHSIADYLDFCEPYSKSKHAESLSAHLFRKLTWLLGDSEHITIPYYDESVVKGESFQLSRALLQYFLVKDFNLDDQEVLRKHNNWFHAPKHLSYYDISNRYLTINSINTSQNYFRNAAEAMACLSTFYTGIPKCNSFSPLYIGFYSSAFDSPESLTLMMNDLLTLEEHVRSDDRRKEWVLVLRGDEYKNADTRIATYKAIDKAYHKKFDMLHVFLLTKDVDDPLSNAYPDYHQPEERSAWTPLADNAGYYLSDSRLFQRALNTKRELEVEPKIQSYIADHTPSPAPATLETKQILEEKKDSSLTNTKQRRFVPTVTHVIRNQAEAREEQKQQQQLTVRQEQKQQQQLTVRQEQKQQHNTQQSTYNLFCIGVLTLDLDGFVRELTEKLTQQVAKYKTEQEKFKLYFAHPEKIDNLWGSKTPAEAAKKIAAKIFGVGYRKYKGKEEIIRTTSSIDCIDTRYHTHLEILNYIERYREGVCFLPAIGDRSSLQTQDWNSRYNIAEERYQSNARLHSEDTGAKIDCFFQWPIKTYPGINGKELVLSERFSSEEIFPEFIPLNLTAHLLLTSDVPDVLSTLPLETTSEEAQKAYYHHFNGSVLSEKKSTHCDHLMAVFLGESPCSSKEEQKECLEAYCTLYREYDETGDATIRAFLQNSNDLKSDLKRLLYVHIRGGKPFVEAMVSLLTTLKNQELSALFYKIYFEKSVYINSLFSFLLRFRTNKQHSLLANTKELFMRLPAKSQWEPYDKFIASFLLSFPMSFCDHIEIDRFWTQIKFLVETHIQDPKEQKEVLALFVDTIAGSDGLRIKNSCDPQIVFRALIKILSSAGKHYNFHEQIKMLAGHLSMAWCDALAAIEQGFLIVCDEMQLETDYLNPVQPGQTVSNGYIITRADFQNALTKPDPNAPLALKTLLFRYLGIEISRESLSYYRCLFESTNDYEDSALRDRVIGWFVLHTTGKWYTEQRIIKGDITEHFSQAEKEKVRPLLQKLQTIHPSNTENTRDKRYQLKNLLRKAAPESARLTTSADQCIKKAVDKRDLNAFLQANQKLLEDGGINFNWFANACIEEALEEQPFLGDNNIPYAIN